MRLTIVNQFYRPDVAPTANLAATLAEHRARAGDDVTIIAGKGAYAQVSGPSNQTSNQTSNQRPADQPASQATNPRVLRLWTPGLGKASHLKRILDYACFYLFAALRLLTMSRQDAIIVLTTPPFIACCAALHKLLHPRTRLILWNMDCYPDAAEHAHVIRPGGWIARACHALNRALFRRLDQLVCLDEAMARLLCGHYARAQPELTVRVIPNFEELARYPDPATRTPPPPWPGAQALGLDGKFVILYMGNMGYGHDFATALEAAQLLAGTNVAFLFVGGGKNYQSIADQARTMGLKNVHVHPYVPKEQVASILALASCALVTLRNDALGVMSPSKIHANLAAGLPLLYIGPATSNVDEAITRHGAGLSLRHGQARELAQAIAQLCADPARHARMRQAARAAFEASYCDQAVLPMFDATILGQAPPLAPSFPVRPARAFAHPS